MRSFSEFPPKDKSRTKGCPRCGGEKNAGSVTVRLHKLGPTGTITGSGSLASKGVSMCESCSVEVYETVEAILLRAKAGEK